MVSAGHNSAIRIVPFAEELAADFARLNYEWIGHYFEIEPHDRELLDHPFEQIIRPGGEILFAIADAVVTGTVAMVRYDSDTFELSKMAVSPDFQGKGIANLLMNACITFAHSRNAKRIFLETNSILETAISLYRKFGFVETRLDPNSLYSRANVRMELAI